MLWAPLCSNLNQLWRSTVSFHEFWVLAGLSEWWTLEFLIAILGFSTCRCLECRCLHTLLPKAGLQCYLHVRNWWVWNCNRNQGFGGGSYSTTNLWQVWNLCLNMVCDKHGTCLNMVVNRFENLSRCLVWLSIFTLFSKELKYNGDSWTHVLLPLPSYQWLELTEWPRSALHGIILKLCVHLSAAVGIMQFIRTYTTGLTLTSTSLGEHQHLSRLKLHRPSSCHYMRRNVWMRTPWLRCVWAISYLLIIKAALEWHLNCHFMKTCQSLLPIIVNGAVMGAWSFLWLLFQCIALFFGLGNSHS